MVFNDVMYHRTVIHGVVISSGRGLPAGCSAGVRAGSAAPRAGAGARGQAARRRHAAAGEDERVPGEVSA